MHAAQPAEQQDRQKTATATADRDWDAPDPELYHADQHANEHAEAEEDKVGDGRGADFIADLRLHPVEVGRAAGEMKLVASLQLQPVEQRQLEPHARDRCQENAVTGFDVDVIVDFADFAVVERGVGQDDLAVFLHQQQAVWRRYFPAEQAGSALHDGNPPGYRDAIANLHGRRVGQVDRLAFAIDGFDRGIGQL